MEYLDPLESWKREIADEVGITFEHACCWHTNFLDPDEKLCDGCSRYEGCIRAEERAIERLRNFIEMIHSKEKRND